MIDNIFSNIHFFAQFLRSPGSVGSVLPSGSFLTHTLVDLALNWNNSCRGLIVDLGAGTGVVSRQLLKQGIAPEQILAVDISARFKKVFNRHCPNVELHIGDARNLEKIISSQYGSIAIQAIISSLPLKSIPAKIVAEIMTELRKILYKREGALIQYTYATWIHDDLAPFGFRKSASKFVPINIPPALVERYFPKKVIF